MEEKNLEEKQSKKTEQTGGKVRALRKSMTINSVELIYGGRLGDGCQGEECRWPLS